MLSHLHVLFSVHYKDMQTTTLYTLCLSHSIHNMLYALCHLMCGTVRAIKPVGTSVSVNVCILAVWAGLALIIDPVMLQSIVNVCV